MHCGVGCAAGERRLFVDVVADPSFGPSKVIRVTDIPQGAEERRKYLHHREAQVSKVTPTATNAT